STLFFFCQAEDGIRDRNVTGVQTCALPISLLFAASRRQHIIETIKPALTRGEVVLCDRFVDSSIAYQGAGREIGVKEVATLNQFATENLTPDLTLYLDVEIGRAHV